MEMSGKTREQSHSIAGGKAGFESHGKKHSDVSLSRDTIEGLGSFNRATKLT